MRVIRARSFNRTSLELKRRYICPLRTSALPFNRTNLELKQNKCSS